MGSLYTESKYLKSIIDSIVSLCNIISDTSEHELQYKLIKTVIKLEQATTEFIDRTGFDSEFPEKTKKFREKLLNINGQLIRHAEKIQSQNGVNFDEITTALKLESEALKEEIKLS